LDKKCCVAIFVYNNKKKGKDQKWNDKIKVDNTLPLHIYSETLFLSFSLSLFLALLLFLSLEWVCTLSLSFVLLFMYLSNIISWYINLNNNLYHHSLGFLSPIYLFIEIKPISQKTWLIYCVLKYTPRIIFVSIPLIFISSLQACLWINGGNYVLVFENPIIIIYVFHHSHTHTYTHIYTHTMHCLSISVSLCR